MPSSFLRKSGKGVCGNDLWGGKRIYSSACMKDIMSVVVKLVNTACPLNHCIFKQMCEAAEADHGDLIYRRGSLTTS